MGPRLSFLVYFFKQVLVLRNDLGKLGKAGKLAEQKTGLDIQGVCFSCVVPVYCQQWLNGL